jgi:hypothetical protein
MSWWTVDSGGGESTGGSFSLYATIAQPDAGLLSGCEFALSGGLWSGAEDSGHIFCDGFESGNLSRWSSFVGGE